MTLPCPVVHFEDADRILAFYQSAFGWTMTPVGENIGNYVLAETTHSQSGRPVTPVISMAASFPESLIGQRRCLWS